MDSHVKAACVDEKWRKEQDERPDSGGAARAELEQMSGRLRGRTVHMDLTAGDRGGGGRWGDRGSGV